MGSRTTLHGLSNLRKWLIRNRDILNESPLLVVSSIPSSETREVTLKTPQVVHHLLSQQLGLRVLSSDVIGAYPTKQDIHDQSELLKRSGAATVVGLGGGNAIDLAKVLPAERFILVPCTYGGTLAASSSHALILDTEEESLIPKAAAVSALTNASRPNVDETTCMLQADEMITTNAHIATLAAISLLDAKCDLEWMHKLLEDSSHDSIQRGLVSAGSSASHGLGKDVRSIALALLCSLLPQLAPELGALSFLASISPSIARNTPELVASSDVVAKIESAAVKTPSFVATHSLDQMMELVHQNSTAARALDEPDRLIRSILEPHSLTQ